MTYDIVNLIIRIVILQFVGATSEIAFRKRHVGLTVLSFGVWLTTFRLAVYRSTSIYIGVFKYENPENIKKIQDFLLSAVAGNVTDIVLMIGVILMYIAISKHLHNPKEAKNGGYSL